MAQIIIVGYQNYDFAKSLVVGEILYKDFCLDVQVFDGLIFTSKNAILSLEKNSIKYPQMQRWRSIPAYVIGQSSAKMLQNLGGNLAYISSNAHGKEFANELSQLLDKRKKYAYFRAYKIVSNLDKELRERDFCVHSIVSYQSVPANLSQTDLPPKGSVLLFTSPSAYHFFLQKFQWDESYRAVALGKTTFNAFRQGIKAEILQIQEIYKATLFLQEKFKEG
ncbi:uroporphyrinogen-III synthase [Helicobacter cholecystus]|uniref:Uroporphyrinogen-III synthase n=1 Tax=Helicobacter cholecystus TaxID=45498 RepID=A0A3D8IWN9_9HELI|nr:uroporphyrinogen-III synthase [Helicobacter cholecystus]RDU69678.1 uroporphyrinogen-III synthase [Helicobacter cholecystus]VEJ24242.1 uroporphyrinogen-III synthase [Helicobacter cholecystus]